MQSRNKPLPKEESAKLDLKDRKLLLALFEDGRASTTALGKKVGISQELATYRIQKLKERKILQNIIPIINYSVLGYSSYRLQIKLNPLSKEERDKLMEEFKQLPNISWLVELSGGWDLVLIFLVKSNQEFNEAYDSFNKKYGNYISDRLFTIVTEITHLPPTYILKAEREPLVTVLEAHKTDLDDTQRKIIISLFENGRKPLLEISRELGVSVTTIKYHLDKLLRDKVIAGFKPVINLFAIGYEHFKITMELENPADEKTARELLMMNDNVVYITKSLGQYDLEFECEYTTVNGLLEFIELLKSRIKIKKHEIIFANKELVINRVPK